MDNLGNIHYNEMTAKVAELNQKCDLEKADFKQQFSRKYESDMAQYSNKMNSEFKKQTE